MRIGPACQHLWYNAPMRIKLSALQVLGTGKVYGVIAVKRLGTRSVRRRYADSSATTAQKTVRSNWARVDRTWQELGAEDVAAWNAYRAWEGLYGYNQYMRSNVPRGLAGHDLYTNPSEIP